MVEKDGKRRGCRVVFGRWGYLLRGAVCIEETIKIKNKKTALGDIDKSLKVKSEIVKISSFFAFFSCQTIEKKLKKCYNKLIICGFMP